MSYLSKHFMQSGAQTQALSSFLRAVLVVCLVVGGLPVAGVGSVAAAPISAILSPDLSSSSPLTIQPNQTSTTLHVPVQQDTYLVDASPTENFGAATELLANTSTGNQSRRPVLRFDLTQIPPQVQVLSATAYFYVTQKSGQTLSLHRVTAPWAEDTATWASLAAAYDPTSAGSLLPDTKNQFAGADVTALVQDWVGGGVPNDGLMLVPGTINSETRYVSKEGAIADQRPYLEVVVATGSAMLDAQQDTAIWETADLANYGACDHVNLGTSGGGLGNGHPLFRFNLDGLPTPITIVSAQLQLTKVGGAIANHNIEVYSLTAAWDEGSGDCVGVDQAANWQERQPGLAWTAPGGDFDATPVAVATLNINGPYTWDVTDLARQWLAGSRPNHGVILGASTTGTGIDAYEFASREHADPSLRPHLVINYLIPVPSIAGRVWNDTNRNGLQDNGEDGLANVGMELYPGRCGAAPDAPSQQIFTNADGHYQFGQLTSGDFCVRVDENTLPPSFASMDSKNPLDLSLDSVTVLAITDADFAYASAYADDRLSVGTYAPCTDIAWLEAFALTHNTTFVEKDFEDCTFTLTGTAPDVADLQAEIDGAEQILFDEYDLWIGGQYTPNDPDYNNSAIVYAPQLINAPLAWDTTQGDPGVILAVLDTGIDRNHPEFTGRLLPGYDFANKDDDPSDDNGHGTHVAGIAAASINNGLGTAGIAGRVTILPVKVLNDGMTGWWSDVSAGITYAVDNGAKVINLSLGGTSGSNSMQSAITYALSKNVIVVASGGNNGNDTPFYPAAYDSTLAVGAVDNSATRWNLSNFGNNIDIVAPGALIWNTYWTPTTGSGYIYMNGTSMAAPHVSGAAALLYSINPNLTPDEIRTRLYATATDLGDPGVDTYYANGLIDIGAAVDGLQATPALPPTTAIQSLLTGDVDGNGLADPGDTVRFRVSVANPNPAPLAGVVVSATIPAATTYVASSSRINGIPVLDNKSPATVFPWDAGGITLGVVPANSQTTIGFEVRVGSLPLGVYAITARVMVQTGEETQILTKSTPVAGTLLQMSVDKGASSAGETLSYQVTSSYTGVKLLQNVGITASIPAGATYVPGSANAGGSQSAGVLSWSLGSNVVGTPVSVALNNVRGSVAAAPTLVQSGNLITVTMTMTAAQNIANVSPNPLAIAGTNGVNATRINGPTPASATVGPAGTRFTWVYRATAGSQAGQLAFGATATDGSVTWPQAQSNSVIVHPPLTFQVVVIDPPTVTQIQSSAAISDGGNLLPSRFTNRMTINLAASIGDFVWNDRDGDAIQDGDEPGIPSVTVWLTNSAGQTVSAVTDVTGHYAFSPVQAGLYTVTVDSASIPAEYTLVTTAYPVLVNLGVGQGVQGADVGLKGPTISVGDRIWYDSNGNGVQDTGEPGVGNIGLDLYLDDGDGLFNPAKDYRADTTVSDSAGGYRLDAQAPGNYFVNVTDDYNLLAGLSHTIGAQSQSEPTPLLNLSAGQLRLDVDFGYVAVPASGNAIIGDLVWADVNGNRQREADEAVLSQVEVCALSLDGGASFCAQTDSNGRYLLELPLGVYSVSPSQSPLELTATDDLPKVINALYAGQYLTADFGYRNMDQATSFGGQIWQDLPVNQQYDGLYDDPLEPGIPNVSVNLIQDTNGNGMWDDAEPYVANITGTDGTYLFDKLLAGSYVARVADTMQILRRFAPTVSGVAGSAGTASQSQPYAVTLLPGQFNNSGNFGYREYEAVGAGDLANPGVIGNTIFLDANGDGVYRQRDGDQGIPGVTVVLNKDGAPVATTTSGLNGIYLFTDLTLGSYSVDVTDQFGVLAGHAATTGPLSGQDNQSQAHPYSISLGLDPVNMTADFGYMRLVTLGDRVWWDVDANGLQSANEPGLPGIPLELRDGADSLIVATTSDADGRYLFSDLHPGTYTVGIPDSAFQSGGLLAGWSLSPQHAGLDVLDSDGNGATHRVTVQPGVGEQMDQVDFGFIIPTEIGVGIDRPSVVRMGETFQMRIILTNTGRTWLSKLPISLAYDPDYLVVMDVAPAADSNGSDGLAMWTDGLAGVDLSAAAVGELGPGQSRDLIVTFSGLQDSTLLPGAVSPFTLTVLGGAGDPDGSAGSVPVLSLLRQTVASGGIGVANPTGVTLADATTQPTADGVRLTWRTVDESRVAGFHVWRQAGEGADLVRITPVPMAAKVGGQPAGATYTVMDSASAPEVVTYELEILLNDGGAHRLLLGRVGGAFTIFMPWATR